MNKQCAVYLNREMIYMHSYCRCIDGFSVAYPPFFALKYSDYMVVGDAAKQALSASRDGVPTPGRHEKILSPLYQMSNTKSWSAFCKNTKHVTLELFDNKYRIVPMKFNGSENSFSPIEDESFFCEGSIAESQMGLIIVESFNKCRKS